MCGVGAVALFASLFMHWYATIEGAYFNRSVGAPAYGGSFSDDGWSNAWQAFAGVDVVLAACVVVAAVAAVLLAWRRATRAAAVAAAVAGVTGLGLVVWRIVDQPFDFGEGFGIGVGGVTAACALSVIAAGGVIALASPGE
jgi:hypothetical protein